MQRRLSLFLLAMPYRYLAYRAVYSTLSKSRIECGINCGIGALYA